MNYDVIVIGAGISGLTAASLLAKRNLKVCVVEAQYKPGGSCGIFKRKDVVFEQGAAMIYGFNERGFSPHRFVFNALEEPIDIIKHDELYAINFGEHRIIFYQDIDMFIEELAKVFPKEKENFKRFYKLLKNSVREESKEWANSLEPSYPSVVLFALVKEEAIPKGTLPIEMLIGDKTKLDEDEITVYILSIDDKTLCKEGYHTIMAIGPTFKEWPKGFKNEYNTEKYREMKAAEGNRVLDVLEKRFPGFKENICHVEISTPTTLNRYVLKEGGSVAGPKQKLGQHMLKRLKTKSEINNLFNCGESTVMGTGTPAVTISGISAANLILRELGLEEFEYKDDMKNYVNIVNKPFKYEEIKMGKNEEEDTIAKLALKCQFCDKPLCERVCKYNIPIRDINRRVAAGNFYGAKKLINNNPCLNCESIECEKNCIRKAFAKPVSIKEINTRL